MREMAIRWRCHLQERERSDLLYLVWLCWGAALLLYVLGSDAYLWPVAPMPLVLLVWLGERFGMFGRKAKSEGSVPGRATVIAAGARFKGELQLEGDLEVRGVLVGTIVLSDGILRIMAGGRVEGEVKAPHVIINGLLDGTCSAAEVEILESGRMQGTFKGGSLSISKGGNFIGHSRPDESSVSSPAAQPANQELESVPVEGKGNVKALAKEGRSKGSEPLAKQA